MKPYDGLAYSVYVSNAVSAITSSNAILSVLTDGTAPTVYRVIGGDTFTNVTVTFSERVTFASAQNLTNYAIGDGVNPLPILSATQMPDGSNVVLVTALQTPGTVYYLTNNGIQDLAYSPNTIAADTRTPFTAWALTKGLLAVDIFTNMAGGAPTDLANVMAKAATNAPDIRTSVRSFDWRSVPFPLNNGMVNYGAKVWGWFTPPSNGVYRFYIRGDDATKLYLNTNGLDRAGKVLIAQDDTCCHAYTNGTNIATGNASASISPAISLTNGTAYYIEGWLKQSVTADYFQVDFRADGTPAPDAPPTRGGDGYPNNWGSWPGAEVASGAYFGLFGNPDAVGSVVTFSQNPGGATNVATGQSVTLSALAAATPFPTNSYLFYQWQNSLDGGETWGNSPGLPATNFTSDYNMLGTGTNYTANYYYSTQVRVVVTALPGGGSATSEVATVTVPESINVVSVGSLDGDSVVVVFDKLLDPVSARNRSFYLLNGTDVPYAVTLRPDGRSVLLTGITKLFGTFNLDIGDVHDGTYGVWDLHLNYLVGTSVSGVALNPAFATDVGAGPGVTDPVLFGSAVSIVSNGVDVVAGGSDIWNAVDGMYYVAWPLTGDFDVRVRIPSMTNSTIGVTAPTAKAGLMARISTNANSRMVSVEAGPPALPWPGNVGANYVQLIARDSVGANWNTVNSPANAWSSGEAPWVRLVRSNDVFFGYYSTNSGTSWTLISAKDTVANGGAYPRTIYVGLATSAQLNTNNLITGLLSAQYRDLYKPAAPTALLAPLNVTTGIHASVTFTATITSEPAGSGPTWIKWFKNGVLMPAETSPNLTFPNTAVTDSGTYTVLIGNDGGASSTPLVASLWVTNGLPLVTNDVLMATQNVARTFSVTNDLLANDRDPENDGLVVLGVYGQAVTFASDFNSGLPAGTMTNGNAFVDTVGGVTNSGVLKLTTNGGSLNGWFAISNLTPGKLVSSFTADFKVLLTGGSGDPGDGFSFNFTPSYAASGEEGLAPGLAVCFDNYNNGATEVPVNGAPAIDIKWNGAQIGHVMVPKIQSTNWLPVSITLRADGTLDVVFCGTNVYQGFQTGYVPMDGYFIFAARTGGAFETHYVDDLTITAYTLHTALGNKTIGGTVTLTNGTIYYTPPAGACGVSDSFYYVVSDGQLGGVTTGTATVALQSQFVISGQVALEGYVGPLRDGNGTRVVTFKAKNGAGTVLSTWNESLNFVPGVDGYGVAPYALTCVPADTVRVSAKTGWNLSQWQDVAFAGGLAAADFTGANQLRAGDINGTDLVDLDDYYLLAALWYKSNPAADIDGNGRVDLDDYFLLANRWLQTGRAP